MDFTTQRKIDLKRKRHLAAFAIAQTVMKTTLNRGLKNPALWRVKKVLQIVETLRAFPYLPQFPIFWPEVSLKPVTLPKAGAEINGIDYLPSYKAVIQRFGQNADGGGEVIDLLTTFVVRDPVTRQYKEIRKAAAVATRGNAYGFLLDEKENWLLDQILTAALTMRENKTYPFIKLGEKTYDLSKPSSNG